MRRLGAVLILTVIAVMTGACRPGNEKADAVPSTGKAANPGPTATKPAAGNAVPDASTHDPAPVPSASATARPLIVCFGDSLTAGYGVEPSASYPAVMQRDLDARGYRYRVVNMGVSGETTKDGLARVARVLALKPQIVVVEFGGNDGLRGLPIADTQNNLDAIVHALRDGGTRVALAGITLPSDYGPDYVSHFNSMYPVIARKYGVPLLPFIFKDVYGVAGDIQEDMTHATAKGNQQVAKNVEELLKPMLRK